MRILCVDGNEDQLRLAGVAVAESGHEFEGLLVGSGVSLPDVIMRIADFDCVITGLFFVPVSTSHRCYDYYCGNVPPAGLLVVLHSLGLGKRVVVCSEMDLNKEFYHHGERFAWLYDGYVNRDVWPSRYQSCYLKFAPRRMWRLAVRMVVGEV